MKKFLLTFIFVIFFNVQAYALELLMFHSKYCGYCMAFMKEVAVDYHYKDLPLVIIDAHKPPEWFKEAMRENRIKPIRGTPTFIIWNGRKELARLTGYSSKEWFYNNLDSMFKK